jgi:hypothetical protein
VDWSSTPAVHSPHHSPHPASSRKPPTFREEGNDLLTLP